MERSYDEHAALYFRRGGGYSALFLLVLGFAVGTTGYHRGGKTVFLVIGAIFAVMAIWLWLRGARIKVTGAEVDAAARRRSVSPEALRKAALKELALDEKKTAALQTVTLAGYTPLGIKTEPLLRWDESDGRARSSNYQQTCLLLGETLMYTYTEVRSLVDGEFYRRGRIWRFDAVTGCAAGQTARLCMTGPDKKTGQVEKPFRLLTVTGENGETFGFAFGEAEVKAAEETAGHVVRRIGTREKLPQEDGGGGPAPAGKKTKAGEIGILVDRSGEL
ncbi:MAG: hypothetical protein IJT76_02015 [Clostridia bacterium]|nr:hypothetical protein [Clostridia bacterium]